MTSDVDVHTSDELHLLGSWRNLFVTMFRGAPTLDRLKRVQLFQQPLVAKFPAGTAVLNLIAKGSVKDMNMTSEVRAEAQRQQALTKNHVIAMGYIVEGDGFYAATARAVINATALMVRTPYPQKVFDRDVECADWLAPAMKQNIAPAELLTTIRHLRQAFEATAPSSLRAQARV